MLEIHILSDKLKEPQNLNLKDIINQGLPGDIIHICHKILQQKNQKA